MDHSLPKQLLLLMFGFLVTVTFTQIEESYPDKDEQHCGNHWICPNNVCYNRTRCRCEEGFHRCKRKGVLVCLGDKAGTTCNSSSILKNLENCTKQNPQDAVCSVLQLSYDLWNASCNATTKEAAETTLNQVAEKITQALSNISGSSLLIPNQTSVLLSSLETTLLKSFSVAPRYQHFNSSMFVFTMNTSFDICKSGVQDLTLMAGENSMKVPCNLMSGKKDGAILITYTDLSSLLNGPLLDKSNNLKEDSDIWVNSNVVSGAIKNSNVINPSLNFNLTYRKSPNYFQKLSCVFWDLERNAWSENGCKTGPSYKMHIICSCNHLSSFAVLMAPIGLEDSLSLQILSYIGLTVSLLCLGMSLLTFILCRSLKSVHTSVLTALCLCLFLGQFLILTGLKQISNELLCKVIAGGLQFLFLCAFCWMSIESVLLFMTVRNLRAVNYMTSQRLNVPVMCVLGFGIPAVIVGISAAVHRKAYVATNYCWLHPSLVWSFLGPACVFISANTVLLFLTVWLLRKRLASLNTNVSTLQNTRSHTYKALAQALILGCTWGIGYFQFGTFLLIASYLFTICNSLQGAYIFIIHCLLNRQVMAEYRNFFCKRRKRLQESTDGTIHSATKSTNVSNVNTSHHSTAQTKASWL